MDVLRALKRHFDPDDIMNPGGTLGMEPVRAAVMDHEPARAEGELILAIDAGTQSMRAALVDLTGRSTAW